LNLSAKTPVKTEFCEHSKDNGQLIKDMTELINSLEKLFDEDLFVNSDPLQIEIFESDFDSTHTEGPLVVNVRENARDEYLTLLPTESHDGPSSLKLFEPSLNSTVPQSSTPSTDRSFDLGYLSLISSPDQSTLSLDQTSTPNVFQTIPPKSDSLEHEEENLMSRDQIHNTHSKDQGLDY
jgi:hypothetical protein